ncbi:MAG: MerR family transcriptional regulator [Verrucomicrobiaceae bacterium]|nr:MAG: MerR family transcriptional regulator [Verrucomicrobiaceae bacterium]
MKSETSPVLTRAALAKAAGVGPETLRFYEKKGLLEKPARNAAGHRLYSAADLERMRFISRAQQLGFSLQDIGQLLTLTGSIRTPRRMVRGIASARLEEIRQKIRDLKSMESALSRLVSQCDGKGALQGCPIAEFMSGGTPDSISTSNPNPPKTCHE